MRQAHGKRGRPRKFGGPSEVIALTLPEQVVRGLRKIHPDLAWAIVTLFEKSPRRAQTREAPPDAELVTVGGGRALIVVNRKLFKRLKGINIIPLDADRAFLALDVGHGMSDLELAVLDRLGSREPGRRERRALRLFRRQLRKWRRDPSLRIHARSIIVVERTDR